MNLFTNSTIALRLATIEIEWYYQVLHHDIWDWDLVTGPLLFEATRDGDTVAGVESLPKFCYVFMWNRETGTPINWSASAREASCSLIGRPRCRISCKTAAIGSERHSPKKMASPFCWRPKALVNGVHG